MIPALGYPKKNIFSNDKPLYYLTGQITSRSLQSSSKRSFCSESSARASSKSRSDPPICSSSKSFFVEVNVTSKMSDHLPSFQTFPQRQGLQTIYVPGLYNITKTGGGLTVLTHHLTPLKVMLKPCRGKEKSEVCSPNDCCGTRWWLHDGLSAHNGIVFKCCLHNFGNHLTRSSNFKGFPNAFASSKITENPRVLLCQLVSQVHVLAMATASTGTEHMLIGPRNTGSECIVKICED